MEVGGGAQVTDRQFILHGIRQGHDIFILTPQMLGKTPISTFDLAIFSNCVTFPKPELKKISESCKYVIFTHDFYLCRWRLYFASQKKCMSCRYMPFWKDLYSRSLLNIFMSPLHYQAHCSVMPQLAKHPHALVPSAINPSDFLASPGIDIKPKTVVSVNCLYGFKGRENVLQYAKDHPDLTFTFIGGKEKEVDLPENCKYVGYKLREDIVKLYGEHEYFLHLPEHPQPFERSPVEFILANPKGKLILNSLVGATSYPWFRVGDKINRREIIKQCSEAPKKFWREIRACLKS